MMTVRTEEYVIQVRQDGGAWADLHPVEEGADDQRRRNLLHAYRQQGTAAQWRLIRRIVIEEDVEEAATGKGAVPR